MTPCQNRYQLNKCRKYSLRQSIIKLRLNFIFEFVRSTLHTSTHYCIILIRMFHIHNLTSTRSKNTAFHGSPTTSLITNQASTQTEGPTNSTIMHSIHRCNQLLEVGIKYYQDQRLIIYLACCIKCEHQFDNQLIPKMLVCNLSIFTVFQI
jgi:hypothetical protein